MNQVFIRTKSNTKIILLLVMATLVLPVWGEQVDENTARQVASQTLLRYSATHSADSTTQLRAQAVSQKALQLLYKSSSDSNGGNANVVMRSSRANTKETVYFYVFGAENNEGFVIVAGDDRITPVLGYSETNGFSVDDMPPALKWWLGEYARQIEFAIKNDIQPTPETKRQWAEYLGTNNNEEEEQK